MSLVAANRYRIATMPGFRIVVDFGGAGLECRQILGGWKQIASGRTLDDLLWSDYLAGVRREDLIPESAD